MMIVSAYGFAQTLGNHVVLDPSRVAAQVVSGIGFLGAGSILLRNEAVKGLTTAASVWAVAGIGLAAGGGLYSAGVATTVIILVILAGLKPLEDRFLASRGVVTLSVTATRGTMTLDVLKEALGRRAAHIRQLAVHGNEAEEREDATVVIARVSAKDIGAIVNALQTMPGVHDIRILEG